jgi:hypothetical protein
VINGKQMEHRSEAAGAQRINSRIDYETMPGAEGCSVFVAKVLADLGLT